MGGAGGTAAGRHAARACRAGADRSKSGFRFFRGAKWGILGAVTAAVGLACRPGGPGPDPTGVGCFARV
ncbi:hypothetical protein LX83_006438 [Goodfellowiella coeruleoviolacea]|uniref:Uncharacterized protein n=1 Tax=Goodfellowiella coeruleoviolacea TaxID=334858 RepID=A0AAE3KJW7_9PSEU|nr:hypothetical protein [Goodfellowiella coeruleoviolacea]